MLHTYKKSQPQFEKNFIGVIKSYFILFKDTDNIHFIISVIEYVHIYLPSTVCFETEFILFCQYFDVMKNKHELKNIFWCRQRVVPKFVPFFLLLMVRKITFYIIATSFHTNVLVQFLTIFADGLKWKNVSSWTTPLQC